MTQNQNETLHVIVANMKHRRESFKNYLSEVLDWLDDSAGTNRYTPIDAHHPEKGRRIIETKYFVSVKPVAYYGLATVDKVHSERYFHSKNRHYLFFYDDTNEAFYLNPAIERINSGTLKRRGKDNLMKHFMSIYNSHLNLLQSNLEGIDD